MGKIKVLIFVLGTIFGTPSKISFVEIKIIAIILSGKLKYKLFGAICGTHWISIEKKNTYRTFFGTILK